MYGSTLYEKVGALALDLRGHGTSRGMTNRLGQRSTPDIGGVIQYLHGRDEVEQVGALSLSMGSILCFTHRRIQPLSRRV